MRHAAHGARRVISGGGSEAARGAAHDARRVISGGRGREWRRRAAEARCAARGGQVHIPAPAPVSYVQR